jgi:MFS family permease
LLILTIVLLFQKGTLIWDKTQRNVIFRTYYLGYLFSQIPAGLMAQKFGGKKVLGFFLLAASVATTLIPFGVRYHYFLLVFLRFVGGIGAVSWLI